ncbi:FTN_0109 family protein [Francisella salimarina]|uniref:FTN_0109 family protein n=1 Tax=Francisella salimarina TaxID=2599927 RepID=UPI003D81B8DB
MRKILSKISLLLLILTVTSCGMLSNDQFVYLGHGDNTPDYQLYYDKTRKLFVLIDKRNGCFQKDDTGTCLAFTLKQTREFREKVLAKMIEIDLKLAKDNYGNRAMAELQKAGITIVNKPIKTESVYATPVRQIVLDRKQQYHLVRKQYPIDSDLVAMLITDRDGTKRIKVAYTVDFPELEKEYNTSLRPYIIDPEFLYTHMTIDTVHEAQFMQRDVLKSQKDVKKEVGVYLNDVVDTSTKKSSYTRQEISSDAATLDHELITKADQDNDDIIANSGSAIEIATSGSSNTSSSQEKQTDSTDNQKTTLASDNN